MILFVLSQKLGITTRFTDAKILMGNQQLLMKLISNGELDMESLNDYPAKKLDEILEKVGIDRGDRRK